MSTLSASSSRLLLASKETTRITSDAIVVNNKTDRLIGTHNGTFHCDEALATAMLKMLPQFSNHIIFRSRDETLLSECEIVVDVGGEYNLKTCRFDHHQKSFGEHFEGKKTKLSSAGLIYKHYGKEIIQQVVKSLSTNEENFSLLNDVEVDLIFKKLYTNFIEHIDGIDNGVDICSSGEELNYKITTSLSSRVSFLNPSWNEDQSTEITNQRFLQAMRLTGTEFVERVLYWTQSWLPARTIVEKVFKERFTIHESGQIMRLDNFCPWKSHLYDIEELHSAPEAIKFVLYIDGTGNMWRIQGVNTSEGQFSLRMGLPTSWRGLRDDELSAVSNIPACTFCHAGGFIGGNKTYEGALQMAIAALQQHALEESSKRLKTE